MADEKDLQEDMPVEDKEETVKAEGDSKEIDETPETDSQNEDNSETSETESSVEEKEEEQEEKEDKKLFKKKQKADKKQDALKEKIDELEDKVKRQMAEFDNFRKRTEKEKASMYVIGAKEIIEKMLPVVDNFERGLANAPEGDPFAEGIQMIYKQLMTTFDEMGVKVIETVGQQFDPNLHNAVMHVDDPEQEDNVIVEEFQKGYTYKDFVVRHSMVKVAN